MRRVTYNQSVGNILGITYPYGYKILQRPRICHRDNRIRGIGFSWFRELLDVSLITQ